MGTGGGLGRVGSGHLVQEPVRGRTEALLVLSAVKTLILVIMSEVEKKTRSLSQLAGLESDGNEASGQDSDKQDGFIALTGRAFCLICRLKVGWSECRREGSSREVMIQIKEDFA